MFGTDYLWTAEDYFFKLLNQKIYNQLYHTQKTYNGLYNVHIQSATTTIQSTMIPSNFASVLAILGGFLSVLTKINGWLLASYYAFQFRKSSIKKLYFYSRTRKREDKSKKKQLTIAKDGKVQIESMIDKDLDAQSHRTLQLSEQSDLEGLEAGGNEITPSEAIRQSIMNPEGNVTKDFFEALSPKARRKTEQKFEKMQVLKKKQEDQMLEDIIKSKTILSFGYKSYLNYWYKISCFNFLSCWGKFCNCCLCCKPKSGSMTARKYKRALNGQKKLNEEFDLIQIVKTLRQARFLINNTMDPKQK